jgi:alpha-tubulin suppressor-like RCC1 family protein
MLFPRLLVNLKEEIIKEVSCGFGHTVAITLNQNVYVWGQNESGQLGLGDSAPQMVKKPVWNKELCNIQKVSCGNDHTIALTKAGQLYSWGIGGVLGHGDEKQRSLPTKVEFFSKTKVTIAVCGGIHTIVLTREGDVFAWGATEGAQLGQPESFYTTKEG